MKLLLPFLVHRGYYMFGDSYNNNNRRTTLKYISYSHSTRLLRSVTFVILSFWNYNHRHKVFFENVHLLGLYLGHFLHNTIL
jgi:hypothetical protein